jgi:hypothetical protein
MMPQRVQRRALSAISAGRRGERTTALLRPATQAKMIPHGFLPRVGVRGPDRSRRSLEYSGRVNDRMSTEKQIYS